MKAAIREAKKHMPWMRCRLVRDRAGWHDYCEDITEETPKEIRWHTRIDRNQKASKRLVTGG